MKNAFLLTCILVLFCGYSTVASLWSFCSQSVLKYRRIIQERKQIVQILDGFLESEKFGKVVQL
jgi:hypothetical protein